MVFSRHQARVFLHKFVGDDRGDIDAQSIMKCLPFGQRPAEHFAAADGVCKDKKGWTHAEFNRHRDFSFGAPGWRGPRAASAPRTRMGVSFVLAWMALPDSFGDVPEFLDALADCLDSGAGLASAARRSGSPSSRSMTAVRIGVRVDGFHNTCAIFMRDSDGTKKKVNVAIGMADRIENSTRKINNENHIKKA